MPLSAGLIHDERATFNPFESIIQRLNSSSEHQVVRHTFSLFSGRTLHVTSLCALRARNLFHIHPAASLSGCQLLEHKVDLMFAVLTCDQLVLLSGLVRDFYAEGWASAPRILSAPMDLCTDEQRQLLTARANSTDTHGMEVLQPSVDTVSTTSSPPCFRDLILKLA